MGWTFWEKRKNEDDENPREKNGITCSDNDSEASFAIRMVAIIINTN